MRSAAGAVCALLLFAGCGEDQAQASGKGPAPEDEALIAAWKKAGLEVSAFTTADAAPYSAQACRAGTVGGIDVTVCSYDTGEDAAAAEDPALALLEKRGVTTASALARGKKLLVVTDKRKADPSGRSINAITGAFRK
jgi:hypothetical protein